MSITANGFKADGVLVLPASAKYKFQVKARGKLDLFAYSTCHRELWAEEAWDDSWFSAKNETEFEYTPTQIEKNDCPMLLAGYEKVKGRNSWALVDFESSAYQLPASIQCNGQTINARGVSICQSRTGLVQQISLPVPVLIDPPKSCPIKQINEQTYQIELTAGECVFLFMAKDKSDSRVHKLTSFGYQEIPLRED